MSNAFSQIEFCKQKLKTYFKESVMYQVAVLSVLVLMLLMHQFKAFYYERVLRLQAFQLVGKVFIGY